MHLNICSIQHFQDKNSDVINLLSSNHNKNLFIHWFTFQNGDYGAIIDFSHQFNVIDAIQKVQRTVKPVVSGQSKRRPKINFKTDYCLMQVKSIA